MNNNAVATLRKSMFVQSDIDKLKKHDWFLSEHKGTLVFQPDDSKYNTDYSIKKELYKYLES